MKTLERIEQLSQLYYEGDTSLREEKELFGLLDSLDDRLPNQYEALYIHLEAMQLFQQELAAIDTATEKNQLKHRRQHIVRWIVGAAASLAVGLFLVATFSKPTSPAMICYIDGEPVEDMQTIIEQLKYTQNIEDLSRSIETLENLLK